MSWLNPSFPLSALSALTLHRVLLHSTLLAALSTAYLDRCKGRKRLHSLVYSHPEHGSNKATNPVYDCYATIVTAVFTYAHSRSAVPRMSLAIWPRRSDFGLRYSAKSEAVNTCVFHAKNLLWSFESGWLDQKYSSYLTSYWQLTSIRS